MTRKQRLLRVIKGALALVLLGTIYLWLFLTFQTGIPCIFRQLTGLKCPGCGMTHAVAALWTGQVSQALAYNGLVLNVLPITGLYMLYRSVRYVVGNDQGFHIWEYALLTLLMILTIGYGVMRNIV